MNNMRTADFKMPKPLTDYFSMRRKWCIMACLCVCILTAACVNTEKSKQHKALAFDVARTPGVEVDLRIQAAKLLDKEQAAWLSRKLVSQLPGNWNQETLDEIQLLGIVGDEAALEKLQVIDDTPHRSTGGFHIPTLYSMEQIRQRLDPKLRLKYHGDNPLEMDHRRRIDYYITNDPWIAK